MSDAAQHRDDIIYHYYCWELASSVSVFPFRKLQGLIHLVTDFSPEHKTKVSLMLPTPMHPLSWIG